MLDARRYVGFLEWPCRAMAGVDVVRQERTHVQIVLPKYDTRRALGHLFLWVARIWLRERVENPSGGLLGV